MEIVASFQTSVIYNDDHGLTETPGDAIEIIDYYSSEVDSENGNDSVPE